MPNPRRTIIRYSMYDELTPVESLWLDLVDEIVQVTRNAGETLSLLTPSESQTPVDVSALTERFRAIVQSTFTALLRATTSSPPAPRFLPILRGFLNRASKSSPSLAHLRQVLSAIFSAYAFEEGILGLATKLLDKDLFVGVEDVSERRRRGWRPLGLACGGCGKKVWGPGAGKEIWEEWYKKHEDDGNSDVSAGPAGKAGHKRDQSQGRGKGKGKGRAEEPVEARSEDEATAATTDKADAVVVFACRHLFHRRCLQDLLGVEGNSEGVRWTCPLDQEFETGTRADG